MKRLVLCVSAAMVLGGAVVFSGNAPVADFLFQKEGRNPVSHLRFELGAEEFQFAIVSDRTGGHRANIFAQAVERLNLLQPAFVLSVGDLIEGGTKKPEVLAAEWKEFDSFVARLNMPFFYVPGNHDVLAPEASKFWEDKLGRRYYHFVYRNVLFLILNTDDPSSSIGNEQIAYARKVLADNPKVRWTIVSMHRPLWVNGADKNGWQQVEDSLKGRNYTVFVGHVHRYQKFVRHGMNYYQLATTGGGSKLRGSERGEFDHIVWVTMKKDGPVFANIMLDAIVPENLQHAVTQESGNTGAKNLPTFPVNGKIYVDGVPAAGAQVLFSGGPKGAVKADGIVAADGTFKLTTYKADDGVPTGEYAVSVVWRQPDRQGKLGPNLLPDRYAKAETSALRVLVAASGPNNILLELRK